jgi:hypothetical protein
MVSSQGMVQVQEGHEILNYLDQFFNEVKPKKSLTLYDEKPIVLLNWTENPSQPTIIGEWVNSTFRILEMNESVSDEILEEMVTRHKINAKQNQTRILIGGTPETVELFCQDFRSQLPAQTSIEDISALAEKQTAVTEKQTAMTERQTNITERQTDVTERQTAVTDNTVMADQSLAISEFLKSAKSACQIPVPDNQSAVTDNQSAVTDNQSAVTDNQTVTTESDSNDESIDEISSDTESLFSIPAEIKPFKTDISTLTGIPIEIADCNDGEVLMKLPYSQELFQNRLEILLGEADNVKIERPDLQDIQGNLLRGIDNCSVVTIFVV